VGKDPEALVCPPNLARKKGGKRTAFKNSLGHLSISPKKKGKNNHVKHRTSAIRREET